MAVASCHSPRAWQAMRAIVWVCGEPAASSFQSSGTDLAVLTQCSSWSLRHFGRSLFLSVNRPYHTACSTAPTSPPSQFSGNACTLPLQTRARVHLTVNHTVPFRVPRETPCSAQGIVQPRGHRGMQAFLDKVKREKW